MIDNFLYKYVAIEGCIGAGKTSFAKKLASVCNGKLVLEEFEENDFLPKFYKNPERYAFPLELSFLAARFNQFKRSVINPELFYDAIVSDYIFPKSLIFSRKTLADDEYNLYKSLFQIIDSNLPKPELIVYLHLTPENLKKNIIKRGREYEQDITIDYLSGIQKSYFDFFREQVNSKIVIVDTNFLDFVEHDDHFELLCKIFQRKWNTGINVVEPFSL